MNGVGFVKMQITEHHRDRRSAQKEKHAHYRDVYDLRDTMPEDFRGMIAAIRPSETVTLKLVLSRLMDYLEENREIVTALIKVNAPDGFGKKMIGVMTMEPQCRGCTGRDRCP